MSLFKNNKNSTIAELEEYYENQRKNRTGRAWVMALLSLFIAVGVVAGLFFGGRWAYKALTNDNTQTTVVVDDSKLPDSQPTDTVVTSGVEPDGVVSENAASTSKPNAAIVGSSQPNLGVQSDPIPNTGPSSYTAGLLLFIALAGYVVARKREIKNL